jgi:hypothetical protein
LLFDSHQAPALYADFAAGLANTFCHKLGKNPHLAQIREGLKPAPPDLARACRSLGV